jgi:ABC-type spermidine/putrescine transport system permease subunit II
MSKRIPALPLVFLLFLAVPIYWLLVMSLKTISEVESGITLIPRQPTLENYLFMLDDAAWYWGYLNALIYVLINVVISVCVAGGIRLFPLPLSRRPDTVLRVPGLPHDGARHPAGAVCATVFGLGDL